MKNNVLDILNDEMAGYPQRASGEDGYRFINKIAKNYLESDKEELINALLIWMRERSEPNTMVAVDIAKNLKLTELGMELNMLLKDIENGKCFKYFYANPVKNAIKSIDDHNLKYPRLD